MTSLADFPGLRALGEPFACKLVEVAETLRTDPNYLAAVMRIESGFRPDARNPATDATGLIQWMPDTARHYGTTVDELLTMGALEQLDLVLDFYRSSTGRIDSAGTAYMLTFLPAFARRPPDFVLGERESVELLPGTKLTKGKVYEQNSGFDSAKKGYFTVGEVKSRAESAYAAAVRRGELVLDCPLEPSPPPPTGSAWWLWLLVIPAVWKRFVR